MSNYQEKLSQISLQLKQLNSKSQRYSMMRLSTVVAGIFIAYFAYQFYEEGGLFFSFFIILVLFVLLVRVHTDVIKQIRELETLKLLTENEVNISKGEANIYEDGEEYNTTVHNYGHDLDVFGTHSLFHFINRCSTQWGERLLASFFAQDSHATPSEEIKERQEVVKELAGKESFSDQLKLFLFDDSKPKKYFNINSIALKNFKFERETFLKGYLIFVPIAWILIYLSVHTSFEYSKEAAAVLVLSNFWIMGKVGKQVSTFIAYLDSTSESLSRLANAIKLISEEEFKSVLLVNKIKELEGGDFYKPLLKLSNDIEQLYIRKNMLGLVVLYVIIPFDILVVFKIRKWFNKYPDLFDKLFDVIGSIEAYNSLGTHKRNYSDWAMPDFEDNETIVFEGEDMGHPLIFEGNNGIQNGGVRNSYTLDASNRISIVTGSNMSGKSTFLRVIGVNLLLAYAGTVVCASSFKMGRKPRLITSMRIADSLRLSESTFKAELERIRLIIEAVDQGGCDLFLVDEMLRGTNSVDKLKGSFALLQKLQESSASHILVATHDLQLSEFEEHKPNITKNYHFDFDYTNNEFDFDYKLKNGVCEKFNASLLLSELGLETE
ncbi:MutS-related protein [Flammeovirga aprica]|uniref:DNA mismatch repair proteins mutS family domain-containing protein n=1 Tax=Flammeovirga aprica JL-4 TaxID=694437 RepID=A0A7X9P0F7_9BACT|nr:hypothetical protein [Flammeovirga aprica]NME66727.1 hypothetical protein [Flammeovirga aprica JL-4]